MNSLTNEQIKAILEAAERKSDKWISHFHGSAWWGDHNLSDLAEILALRERMDQLEQGGWIRVDERLPDTDGVYLTYNPRSYFYLPEQVMRFIKGGWEFSNALITHWSNLPQLPKEQDND
jgi:hypothetical protein